MNSEKVKKIKKALEFCANGDCWNCIRTNLDPEDENECRIELLKEALTLINELESENERIKRSKNIAVYRLEHRIDRLEHQIAETIMETAEKIFVEVLDLECLKLIRDMGWETVYNSLYNEILELAKQFGVEIKEGESDE